jgi:RimJ/RimL family protein N-acetyltransferase
LIASKLVTDRLELRPFRFSDAPDFHAYINDPDMGTYLEVGDSNLSLSDASQIIARHLLADPNERVVWAIDISGKIVGAISLNLSKGQRISEIGYSVKKPLWGQGIAREAVAAVIGAAFDAYPQLQRVQANIHPDNKGSIRVAESVGMRHEGTLRSYALVNGQSANEAVYAVIRDEWLPATE